MNPAEDALLHISHQQREGNRRIAERRETKIVTEHVYPPIPIRQFDWAAYDESYEPPDSDGVGGGIVGWGRTEAEAIADYRQLVEDAQ